MLTRSCIAVLLLINYLLVVGMGCMSRPEDQHEFVMVQTDVNGHYEQCRYMRMDGLENFLAEALASRYQNAPETPKHHLITVISGVDAHCLPYLVWPVSKPVYEGLPTPFIGYPFATSAGISRADYPPPRINPVS